jgi:hypothetical protein
MQNIVTNTTPVNTAQLVQANGMADPVNRNPETKSIQGGSGQVYGPAGWQNVGAPACPDCAPEAPVSEPIGGSDNFTGGCSS